MNCSESLFYIVFENINGAGYEGVKKKINAQMDVFGNEFGKVFLAFHAYGVSYLYDDMQLLEKKMALSEEGRFDLYQRWMEKYNCTKVYMRCHIPATYNYLRFLKSIYDRKIRLVLEYPTYPYEGEIKDELVLREDREYREGIKEYVKKATTYKKGEVIYGIDTIILNNGLDLRSNPVRKARKKGKTINLLTVSNLYIHHGYERVLEGLRNYYLSPQDYNIFFYIVGTGSERTKYEHLIEKYNLQEHAKMCGVQVGDKLNEYYSIADIGIGPMGLYKAGAETATPIKTKEYCGRGLPFVYGYIDEGFSGEERYLSQVSNDETPLDMNVVIDLYERTVDSNIIIQDMRMKAEKEFDWKIILQEVVEFFKSV